MKLNQKTPIFLIMLVSFSFLITGCALNDQYLVLDPKIYATESDIGGGKTIELGVRDKRSNSKLGEIKDVRKDTFSVEVKQGFTTNIKNQIGDALERKGFKIDESDIKMVVDVETLGLSSIKYPLTFKTDLEAIISVTVENGDENYGNRLRIVTTKETPGPPYAADSTELVNEAVSTLLTDMLGSEKLLKVLAK
ncbi:MAG: hypothetical protein CMK56_06725 [Proteobacteria bacterium]|nr:hypothetical protein [Pseudomonadota bacterium]